MRRLAAVSGILTLLLAAAPARPYPVDGGEWSGIARLEGFRRDQARLLVPGARLSLGEVDLRLSGRDDLFLPPSDPALLKQLQSLLGEDRDSYAIAVLDLSDPDQPRYAEHRGEVVQNPGSVGKLLIALGVFQALADLYPDDLAARERLLRLTQVTADDFILRDTHKVPFWNPQTERLSYRALAKGDRASLLTYLDWMLSASSNAAASMVLKELLLLRHFGRDYPVPRAVEEKFWRETPRQDLSLLLGRALQDPVPRNGLELNEFRQGSFFTTKGKQLVPGTTSYASPRMLMRFLLRLEQGKLVDSFSSREIKRLLYMTERRIRYASSPALNESAVYFKSGSLYRCKEEAGFVCRKYEGNVENLLNSVAIVESPAKERRLFYLVVVMSNVLKKNSSVAHQTLATRVHRLIELSHRSEK